MSYTAWSVIFGEVPSESKWNTLGDNDASFNDGTGILDDSIVQRHFSDSSVGVPQLTSELLGMREIGREELSAAATELEVVFTAKTHIQVLIGFISAANNVNINIEFNNDTSANYSQRYSSDHGAGTADPSVAGFAGEVGNVDLGGCEFIVIDLYNPSGADKAVNLHAVHQGSGLTAANVPTWTDLEATWNSNAQVTSIKARSLVTDALPAGSKMIVLGGD